MARWSEQIPGRHPKCFVQKQKATDPRRQVANNAHSIEAWSRDFRSTYLEWGIRSSDCWNMDELGLQVGMRRNQKIITKDVYQQSYIGSVTNCELVTVVEATVSVVVERLYLHRSSYRGRFARNAGILRQALKRRLFSLCQTVGSRTINSATSGSSTLMCMVSNLRQIVAYRLLLLDGYRSHRTYKFLDHCEKNNNVPFYLPPHTTHLLPTATRCGCLPALQALAC